MKKTFDHVFMKANRGCYSEEQLMNCSFMKKQEITLQEIFDSEIILKDKYWFVCTRLATKEQNQQIAIGVAEIVLEIYEKRYPKDKRPREAIQAAKDYLAGTIGIDELRAKRAAAFSASASSAAAAAAADAAAFATYVAASGSPGNSPYNTYATYANANYASVYYDTYVGADINNSFTKALESFLIEFCKNV